MSIYKDLAQVTHPTIGPSLFLDDGDLGLVRSGPGACGLWVILRLSPGRGRGDAAQTDAMAVHATHPGGATCSGVGKPLQQGGSRVALEGSGLINIYLASDKNQP